MRQFFIWNEDMTRLALKIAILLIGVSSALTGLIRAQPYDSGALAAFFAPPEGCPAPCWQGIRPGLTTASNETLRLLPSMGVRFRF